MWFLLVTLALVRAEPTVIRPGVIFDGRAFHTGQAVVIEGDRIVAVLPVAEAPEDLRRVDAPDATLLPGLVDAHVHATEFARAAVADVDRTGWGRLAEEAMSAMPTNREDALVAGVTTWLDLGGATGAVASLRSGLAAGKRSGPTLLASGPVLTAVLGHPADTMYPGDHDGLEQAVIQIATEEGAREAVDRIASRGFDYVKVAVDDGHGHRRAPGDPALPALDESLLRAIVEQAEARELRVFAHVSSEVTARRALRAGVHALEHAFVPDAALLEEMAAMGVTWTPTLVAEVAYAADPEPLFAAIGQARALGVPIAAGTDFPWSGGDPGGDLYAEIALLERAGLTRAEALAAAISVGAAKVGREAALAPGAPADLVLLDGDLRTTAPSAAAVRQVWKAGIPQRASEGFTRDTRRGFRRFNVIPTAYFYYEPVQKAVIGAGMTAFDVLDTGTVALVDVQWSILNQWSGQVDLLTPSPIPRTSLALHLHLDNFDALWYGRGNDAPAEDELRYNDLLFAARVEGDTTVVGRFAVRTGYELAWTRLGAVDGLPDHLGAEGGWLNTLSIAPRWDGRDLPSDPWRGTFVEARLDVSQRWLGASYANARVALDLRQYLRVVDWHVVALRLVAHQAFGEDTPFQQLPAFGGAVGRGFSDGRWRDALSLTGQVEYRGRLWRVLHLGVFADVGQVASGWGGLTLDRWHVALGAGPRVRINNNQTLAWDVGFGLGPRGSLESWTIYFHAGQAF